jgi:mannose/fructose/N-acetylgalactosamine-specific phosphotransferase system component IIC
MELYPVLLVMAGIVTMDTTAGPQFLVSEPFVSCSLLGLLFGNIEAGLTLGILFQLLWFGYLPLGTVHYTDSNLAAFISTASVFTAADFFGFEGVLLNASFVPAMLLAVIIGNFGLYIRNLERRLNGERSDSIIKRLENGEQPSIAVAHMTGIGIAFFKGVMMTLLFVPLGTILIGFLRFLPSPLLNAMAEASMMVTGAAAASAVMFYWVKRRHRYIFAGLVGGFLWILSRTV